ncbi:unnamed protein product [Prorocentrum cordatum]|uniref:Secreted protein n=1 Tax=Prorocentrum cordatum TaxID=2364126 RepID=A0ABN9T9P6_9DINO|nr:unnamed protein product [Polarella glacialis]
MRSHVALGLILLHAWPRSHWRSAVGDAPASLPLPDGEEDVLASPVPASTPWPVAAALRSPGGRRTRGLGAAAAHARASAARLGCAPRSKGLPTSQSHGGP